MSLPADYHIHTVFCRHAAGDPTDYAAQAVQFGLTEIGFSEHAPMLQDDRDQWHMRLRDLDTYVQKVEEARRNHPQLTIRLALEIDFIPGQENWIRNLAARHPWDYFIGSVHYILDDWDFDNPAGKRKWDDHGPSLVWKDYLERLLKAAESGLFDILGHIDLCKKFGYYPTEDFTPLFEKALRAVKRQGMAMELNTSGLRKACKEIYPSPPIVQMAANLGVPITFGSDAHYPKHVAADFALALQVARGAGYTHYRRYQLREPVETRIRDQ